MPQVFKRRANALARNVIIAMVLFVAVFGAVVWGYFQTPYNGFTAKAPYQPVPFSHKHHVGALGIDCRYCHNGVTKSGFAGIPPTHTCMTCHSQLWTNAAMLEPVRRSLETDTPIRWKRVTKLPDYVYFNHSVHVNHGVPCEACHGRVDKMPLIYKVHGFRMRFCVGCHLNPAPHLRPEDHVFDMGWQPDVPQSVLGPRLMKKYDINTAHLTDCYVCHR
ncbi:MAG TPA: cytochrome c3 family protein [Gammaproteobacteria bacterium]|nr:cytochrome c3 family protein [Gammaproteobacteria bacterium]